ncbi:acetate uptake transporter [Amycolatopsis thermophila]|uniref:Succinate-acetate transporter protein n=1 Tax=Amycolatopsis thermophila TaxID=206084 RepID=A0ABU0F2S9_9PSEU|nr:acetate uptake transporter [Amycolatopsis thermophila]MDQ0381385.1 succinate-acetate transporter protein [Amycolatopsis thermophila]
MVHTEKGAVEAPVTPQVDPGAHIADPAPLGLAAFAMTTFVLSVFNANLISNTTLEAVVLPLALFYGGLAQFLAGMWEFRKGNTFGALAFTSFGAFWLSFAAYVKFVEPGLGASAATATGLFLLAWTIFTAYMTVAAARVSGAVLAVFVFLTLTFLFLTIGVWASSPAMAKVGGWLGLVTAVLAWYASFAGVTNFTWKRTLVPLFPLSSAPHR